MVTNTNANGTWTVTKIDTTHYSLDDSVTSGSAGSGGVLTIPGGVGTTWSARGLRGEPVRNVLAPGRQG